MAFPPVVNTNETAVSTAGTSHAINLPASLKKGMYVLDVKAGEQSFQKKLMKQ